MVDVSARASARAARARVGDMAPAPLDAATTASTTAARHMTGPHATAPNMPAPSTAGPHAAAPATGASTAGPHGWDLGDGDRTQPLPTVTGQWFVAAVSASHRRSAPRPWKLDPLASTGATPAVRAAQPPRPPAAGGPDAAPGPGAPTRVPGTRIPGSAPRPAPRPAAASPATPVTARPGPGAPTDVLGRAAGASTDRVSQTVTRPIPVLAPTRRTGSHRTGSHRAVERPATGRSRRAPGAPALRPSLAARAAVLAVLAALVGGSATALAMDKTVTVTVDGRDRVVHTFGSDVSAALTSAGIAPAPQDRVEPALPTPVAAGDHVIVDRARRLVLDEGPSQREVWTTASTVSQALAGLGVEAKPLQMSAAPNAAIPLDGLALKLNVPRAVTLTDGSGAKQSLSTTAGTVAGLLSERHVKLGPQDVSVPGADTPLADGTDVQVIRNGLGQVVETHTVPPPVQRIEDPTMPRGAEQVVDPGKPGVTTAIMRIFVQNGRETRREQVGAGGLKPARPRIVKVGTNDDVQAAPAVDDGSVWDRIAKCEATGNWAVDSGNGYYGGLQFDAGTWRAYGGTTYAALPSQASRDEQIAVAQKVRDARGGGYGAWPACSRKLGLPQ